MQETVSVHQHTRSQTIVH